MMTPAIDRVGLPEYMWLVETNTGVASTCFGPEQCATTFSGPEGLAASFNRSVWRTKGDVISTELRAFSNSGGYRGQGPDYLIGMDGFGPNINIVRDPRFGRNSELPGEDPYLTGEYAQHYVRGMQQIDRAGYVKMLAYLKHYDAYSVETNRGHDNYNISAFDFWDTYLPAFERGFVHGRASGLMCSYNGENGHPSCANGWLLNTVMRSYWGAADALVMSDCGAVNNLRGPPANAPDDATAAAWALNNGTDLEAGSTLFGDSLAEAITRGLTNESTVDRALHRSIMQLMRVGRFDAPDLVSWTGIDSSAINSTAHQDANYDAALQAIVLLKNDNDTLPLKAGASVAVVGPQALAQYGLLSDYFGDEVCYDGQYDCIKSIYQAIREVNVGGKTTAVKGVDINSQDTSDVAAAIAAAQRADIVILALGIDKSVEYEGVDRDNITLPGLQEWFALKILSLSKPTVLVLTNGGALAIDRLVSGPGAIVEAFNPSTQGARALASLLYGRANRWGKLPITLYPAEYTSQVSLTDFSMSAGPGRTYRYYTGTPLWPFGFGLSLSTFELSCALDVLPRTQFAVRCVVSNTGARDGDEVVLLYHRAGSDIRSRVDHPVPLKQLVQFERVQVLAGQQAKVNFALSSTAVELTNSAGRKVVYSGTHEFVCSRGHGDDVVLSFTI